MEQTLRLLDVYNNAFGAERERLTTILESDYLNFVEETQHRDAKKRFFLDMQTEFNSRYHLGLEGFVFGLVRFETYFDDEMKLFWKKSIEMNFEKAKEKFLASWPNDSRRKYIVDFFENPTELVLQELGKLKAWRELGYNSFGYPDDFCLFDDDTLEEEIDLAKIVMEVNQHAEKKLGNQPNGNASDNEKPQLECIDKTNVRLDILFDFLSGEKIVGEIDKDNFILHLRGRVVEPKINIKVSLKYVVWLFDNLHFIFPPNLYEFKDDWFSISSRSIIDHFTLYGKAISKNSLYNARSKSRRVSSREDKSYLIYEQIIKELKNTKDQCNTTTDNQILTK